MTLIDLDNICRTLPGQDVIAVASADYYTLLPSFTTDENGRVIYLANVALGTTRPVQIIIDPTAAVGSAEGG